MRYLSSFRQRAGEAGLTLSSEVDTKVSGVTIPAMSAAQILHRSVVEQLVTLADDYATSLTASLPAVSSPEMLHKVVAGTLLSFLSDALKVDIDA